jgi:hypothetical protein
MHCNARGLRFRRGRAQPLTRARREPGTKRTRAAYRSDRSEGEAVVRFGADRERTEVSQRDSSDSKCRTLDRIFSRSADGVYLGPRCFLRCRRCLIYFRAPGEPSWSSSEEQ